MRSPHYITHEEIRNRAREIWERSGRPEDRDLEFWLKAETQLRAERDRILEPGTVSDAPTERSKNEADPLRN